jgi:hypothetical protein
LRTGRSRTIPKIFPHLLPFLGNSSENINAIVQCTAPLSKSSEQLENALAESKPVDRAIYGELQKRLECAAAKTGALPFLTPVTTQFPAVRRLRSAWLRPALHWLQPALQLLR